VIGKKLIIYELNEVPFRIFNYFSNQNYSAFNFLSKYARKYETLAEDVGHLSPWITWPSLHRGVSNEQHEISDFGMDLSKVNKEYPPLWEILSKKNKIGVFGSLHTYPLPNNLENYKFFVPDTFAAGKQCFPKKYEVFQDFNLTMASINARNVEKVIALKKAKNFLLSSPSLGLSGSTILKVIKQLFDEKIKPERVVRRRTTQVQLAFDFYFKALKENKPDISFFFTNHVASSMHRYWPGLFPEDYKISKFSKEWKKTWKNEIPFTIYEANDQIQKLINFVNKNKSYSLVVLSSMGQAAVDGSEMVDNEIIIEKLDNLMQFLGIEKNAWEKRPAMVPQYIVKIKDQNNRIKFLKNMSLLKINNKNLKTKHMGENIFKIEIGINNQKGLEIYFNQIKKNPEDCGLKLISLQDAAGANAYHIPEGILLVYDPLDYKINKETLDKISTLNITPSILKNFSYSIPSYMTDGYNL
tara:strand:+ start:220 stop:1629 length:1410 start_codon:yes stop_codon:yes gene_type:complete